MQYGNESYRQLDHKMNNMLQEQWKYYGLGNDSPGRPFSWWTNSKKQYYDFKNGKRPRWGTMINSNIKTKNDTRLNKPER